MTNALRWILILLMVVGAPYAAFADDAAKDDAEPAVDDDEAVAGEDEIPVFREAENAELKTILPALKKAAKEKNTKKVRKTLDLLKDIKHPELIKPLVKLLGHVRARVAEWAAEELEFRATTDDVKLIWKKGWSLKQNKHRYHVKGKLLRAFGRMGHDLDKKQVVEVERTWDFLIENPVISFGDALANFCWYFGARKDKRFALRLAKELDQPGTNVSPHDPSNPPADWWEKRVKMWQAMRAAAATALKKITGQEFETVAAAKAWFEANEKTFGVKWSDW